MENKPTIHQSALTMKCGMQVYYRHIEGIKVPPGIAAISGTALHGSVYKDLKSKLDTGKPLNDSEIPDAAGDAFEEAISERGVLWSEDDRDEGIDAVRAKAKDLARAMGLAHHRALQPNIDPYHLEKYVRVDTGDFSHDLAGTLDVVAHGVGGWCVRDTKSSKSKMYIDNIHNSVQLDMYTVMAETVFGPVSSVALDVVQKTKVPKAYSIESPAPRDHSSLQLRISAMAKMLEAGVFVPVDPGGPAGWVCTAKFCGYFDRCPHGRARVKQFSGAQA